MRARSDTANSFMALVVIDLVTLGSAVTLTSCADPVVGAQILALGPEDPTVPVGPLHRPNQPCLVCHQAGGTEPAFTLAGTIYREKNGRQAAAGAEVILIDSAGQKYVARTNCAGNFYVEARQFTPRFPLWATLRAGTHTINMESAVFREGSCASCHTAPAAPNSAGPVFLTDDPTIPIELPAVGCK